jgi:hypothetical protein
MDAVHQRQACPTAPPELLPLHVNTKERLQSALQLRVEAPGTPCPADSAASKQRSKESDALSIVFNQSWVKLGPMVGEGAFSRVYEGLFTDPKTQEVKPVAVKILKKSMLKRKSDCLRFIKEAKVMTRLSHR